MTEQACHHSGNMGKTDSRTLSPAALNERRWHAVMLRELGLTLREVAARSELSIMTVMTAHRAYQAGGWQAVAVKPRGRKAGDGRQLSAAQEAEIHWLICERNPQQLQLEDTLWSRRAVQQLLGRHLGIALPLRTVGDYLQRWGFTSLHHPLRSRDPQSAALQHWLAVDYPNILTRAKTERAHIHWGGQSRLANPISEAQNATPPGKAAVRWIQNHGQRRLIMAESNQGKLHWQVFTGSINAAILIDFFQHLIRDHRGKIFLVLAPDMQQYTRTLTAWLAGHSHEIALFYMPTNDLAWQKTSNQ